MQKKWIFLAGNLTQVKKISLERKKNSTKNFKKIIKKIFLKDSPILICLQISLKLMYFGLRTSSIIQGVDPANEAGSFTTIAEDFNTELDNFLVSKD